MDFSCFSAAAFAECQSRLARNEITENLKNMQITAEICKHQAQTKKINKTPIDNLQAAECKQLHQTPISKYGGGGARAAWRIRIRRPPSGCRAFWTHCQTLASSCQTPKASCGHRPARRPSPKLAPWRPLAAPSRQLYRFQPNFLGF